MGGVSQGIRRYRGRLIAAAVVVAIPALALAWWLGSPLFINKTVDEEFPLSVNAVVPEGMAQVQVEETMATMAMMDTEVMAEAMPSITMDDMVAAVAEEMASGMMTSMTPETITELMAGNMPEGMMEGMAQGAVESVVEMMAAGGPVAVKSGMFRDADSFHQGEGSATVYELPDGSHVLRFEDFRVTNGPDLRVLLATHPDPQGRNEVQGTGYVELGKLKGNIGNQNYSFPEGVSPDDYGSVVIYCKPFHVVFSVAPLSDG
ncbi:MAG: DM13 domain-containing protein [Chloroflexi bacterium]|nr:DM13 domain-containing protein [Chloroflexota bacterium]